MKIIRHFFTNIKVSNTNIALFWFFVCSISITNGQALLTDFGTANAYQITYPANLNGVIPQGMEFTFRALNANTGASTLQVNGITATSIVKNFNIPLAANDIKVGHFVKVIYDGTNWQMLSSSANPSTGTIGGGGTVNGIAFFTNNSAITADGTNFSYNNGTYTDLSLGKIKIRSKAIDGDNLAFGANAGNTTMAGTFNVMVGGSSGAVITSGSDNAFLGAGAGSLNTSGSSNSFFGSGAGNANSSGQFNTFIGNDAGSVNTSGTNLVVIGKGANVATNNLNNAIAIGANSNVSGNNMMALGGTGTDAVKVGIGTGTPLNTLDVVGGVRIRNLSSVGTNMVAVNAAGDLQIASAGSFLTGSGTTGQVPYFASSSALLGSNIFRYDGSNVAINTNPAGSYLFQVLQNTSSFPAIYGENDQLSGVGIWGYSSNASGQAGVRGVAVGTGYGVYGSSSGTGYGVFGANSSTGPGVYGQNTSGGIAGFFDAGGTGVAGFFSGRVGIGIAAPAFSLVSRTSAVATTAETLAQFDVSDGGGSYLQIKNATSVNSTFEPVIEGNLVGSNNSFVIRGVTNNDAAGAPLVQIDSKFTSSALTTKPLFGVSNNGTQYLSIGPTGVTRVNNLSGTGGAVFANTSGDLFINTSSGANAWTINGTNVQTTNNAYNVNIASTAGVYAIANVPVLRRSGNSIFLGTSTGITGDDNLLYGKDVSSNISGSNNLIMGVSAGQTNTSGSNNIFFGLNAGKNNQTGSNNIAIGNGAGVGSSGLTNTIALGQNASANTSNTMTIAPSITSVGLNTNAPKNLLDVNGNIAIGAYAGVNAAPSNGLIVSGNVGIGTTAPGNNLQIENNGGYAEEDLYTYGNNYSAIVLGKARGTQAAPAATLNNDVIGAVIFRGHNGTTWQTTASQIRVDATENFIAGTNMGSRIVFSTVQNASATANVRMTIDHAGAVSIGDFIAGSRLGVDGGVAVGTNYRALVAPLNGMIVQGNVGLGTSVPGYKLHVVETSAIPNYSPAWITFTSTGISGGNPGLNVETFGNAASGTPAIYGIYSKATLKSTFANGVTGIYGQADKTAGNIVLTGVWGEANTINSAENYGTYGRAFGSSLANYGITGITSGTGGANNYGGYFQANSSGTNNYGLFVTVAGTATNKYAAVFMGGNVGIGSSNPNPQAALEFGSANGTIIFAPSLSGGVTRQLIAANQAANTFAGDPVLIGAGNGGTAGAGNVGGNISISGGNAAGTNPNNGGNIVLTPGNRAGTGLQGVVILKDGHLQSTQTTAPVAVVSVPGAGTGATCTLSNATDIAGRVNLTTGTAAWAVGTQCRITFNKPFSVPPIIIITPANAIAAQNLGGRQIFATTSNTFFDISFGAAAVSAVAYQFNYVIIETQ